MKETLKRENAITLVALIITIIILIILAAVTIMTVTKNNLVGIATDGTQNYARAQVDESKKMDDMAQKLKDTVSNITSIQNQNGGTGEGGGETPPTPAENKAPKITVANAPREKKTSNSITIETMATDEDSDELTYTLSVQKEGTSTWQTKPEWKASKSAGEQVELKADELESYTYYNWKIEVTDGKTDGTDTKNSDARIRTFCAKCEEEEMLVHIYCSGCGALFPDTPCSNCGSYETGSVTRLMLPKSWL